MMNKGEALKTGQLVVVQQPSLALLQWLLRRIVRVNVSLDSKVRSAEIKTNAGVITHPLTRLVILPLDI